MCNDPTPLAIDAAVARRQALRAVTEALLQPTPPIPVPRFKQLAQQIGRDLAQAPADDFDFFNSFGNTSGSDGGKKWRALSNFALQQLVAPSSQRPSRPVDYLPELVVWLRAVQHSMDLPQTPLLANEQPSTFDDPSVVTSSVKGLIQQARAAEQQSKKLLDDLVQQFQEKMRAIVRRVRRLNGEARDSEDLLFQDSFLRLMRGLATYREQSPSFWGWWKRIVQNQYSDSLRRRNPVVTMDPSTLEDWKTHHQALTGWEEFLSTFSPEDWRTIQGWAEDDPKVAVISLVGWGLVPKVKADPNHWQEFQTWLVSYGLSQADLGSWYEDDQMAGKPYERIKVLTKYSGGSEKTVWKYFYRPFSGIRQRVRQSSFGKCHKVVELDFFWELNCGHAKRLDTHLSGTLDQLAPEPRVTVLYCAPAWPLLGNKQTFGKAIAGYKFGSVPPHLEFLRELDDPNLPLTPETMQPWQRSAAIREHLLAHAGKGNLAQRKEDIRLVRQQLVDLETTLRQLWRDQQHEITRFFHPRNLVRNLGIGG